MGDPHITTWNIPFLPILPQLYERFIQISVIRFCHTRNLWHGWAAELSAEEAGVHLVTNLGRGMCSLRLHRMSHLSSCPHLDSYILGLKTNIPSTSSASASSSSPLSQHPSTSVLMAPPLPPNGLPQSSSRIQSRKEVNSAKLHLRSLILAKSLCAPPPRKCWPVFSNPLRSNSAKILIASPPRGRLLSHLLQETRSSVQTRKLILGPGRA